MQAKGRLLIVGGHEDKGEVPGENLNIKKRNRCKTHFEILGALISKVPRQHHIIEIIASASSIPLEMEALYIASYKQEGFTHVGIIKVETREDAQDPVSIKKVQTAHAVFFTGGDQNKLVALMGGTPLLEAISHKYQHDQHFIVGGTSAGAMAIPEHIIGGGAIAEALFRDDLKTGTGFGLISKVIVDTHFIKRGRFGRLAHAVALNPDCLGIGLGEDTALIISDGDRAECIGSGMVILVDGQQIQQTNAGKVDDHTPIVVENLIVNILAEGSCFLLQERKFLPW